jgi:hypothetical protein
LSKLREVGGRSILNAMNLVAANIRSTQSLRAGSIPEIGLQGLHRDVDAPSSCGAHDLFGLVTAMSRRQLELAAV